MFLNPKKFGLHSRVVLFEKSDHEIVIIINRKSRIIMKDGKRILEQVKKIKAEENKSVSVKITAPICSKTRVFINNAGISINNINS